MTKQIPGNFPIGAGISIILMIIAASIFFGIPRSEHSLPGDGPNSDHDAASAQVAQHMAATVEDAVQVPFPTSDKTHSRPLQKHTRSAPPEQQSLWNAFRDARLEIRHLTDHQRTMEENEGAEYLASNHQQDFRVRFLRDRSRIHSNLPGRKWSMELGLRNAGKRTLKASGSFLEYRQNGLTEWYRNRPEGLEHGFTIAGKTPDLTDPNGGGLRVSLKLNGLKAKRPEGQAGANDSLLLLTNSGEPVLKYDKIVAWDANGMHLASHMKPTSDGIDLVVSDQGASYPIMIDPLITSLEQKLGPAVTGGGSEYDRFGYAVDIDGSTAVITANDGTYVFVRSGSTWIIQDKLVTGDGDTLGSAVSIDGDTVLVGNSEQEYKGTAYVFVRSGSTWSLQQKLTAYDRVNQDQYGYSVCLDGDTAVIGARQDDDNGTDSGSVYVYTRSESTWTLQQKLIASGVTAYNLFGASVALSADTMIVGALNFNNPGSAYVFTRSGSTWSEGQKIIAEDGTHGDKFGVCMHMDGDSLVVGARSKNVFGSGSGAAYVFTRSGSTWAQQQRLTPNDGAANDSFGTSVSIDGDNIVVGAPYDTTASYFGSGSAYVFTRSGSAWSQYKKLTASDISGSILFGRSVVVHGDKVICGVPDDSTIEGGGTLSGSAYIFQLSDSTWNHLSKLTAGDAALQNEFGYSVSIDGNTAVVGAYNDNDNGTESGSAYVFRRTTGIWAMQQKIVPDDGASRDMFGTSVCVEGGTLIIGAEFDDDHGNDSGSAYVYTRTGSTWSLQQKITPGDGAAGDGFGSVGIHGDTAVVGARFDDDIAANNGSLYVYFRSASTWALQQKITPADGQSGDNFGVSVSIDAHTIISGARLDNDKGYSSGSAYVYHRSGTNWTLQAKLYATDGASPDLFGSSVSISGNTVIVGAPGDKAPNNSSLRGSAYIFQRTNQTWSQQQKLSPSVQTSYYEYGRSVCIDQDVALVGTTRSGAYVYERSGNVWSLHDELFESDVEFYDAFGFSVCVDGDTALVGAKGDKGEDSFGGIIQEQGSVYVYRLSGNSDSDALTDYEEINIYGTDPNDPDSDGDGLTDDYEVEISLTDPNNKDTDADGYFDGAEITAGSDPGSAASVPNFASTIASDGETLEIRVHTRTGHAYTLQKNATLSGAWLDVGISSAGTGQIMIWSVERGTDAGGFWRVFEFAPP